MSPQIAARIEKDLLLQVFSWREDTKRDCGGGGGGKAFFTKATGPVGFLLQGSFGSWGRTKF